MICVYTSPSRGTGGATVINPNVDIGGQSFTYENNGRGLPQLVLNTDGASDSVNILAALQYLHSIGAVSSSATIEQLQTDRIVLI
jgi:hypothetical protein